ncbi:hypothetical protein DRE_04266 [Drechslerella stenobrocha 248]|uniref:Zinc-regulated transporter 2 n=1 Tax=Drechslerella stenobrocha 248 TaxID=1043628 RepID=W7I316_9PEZI|nr:hypothetical protein DRE_04266 [Drechslerella stenobrocha 248]
MEDPVLPPDAYTITQTIVCNENTNADDQLGLRISAIFVIMVGSMFGALFPIFAQQFSAFRGQKRVFFFVKYFGSGVIVATAFIHLLAPANEALGSPCLNDTVASYPWAEGIALMAVFSLFFVELLATSFATLVSSDGHSHGGSHSHSHHEKPRQTSLPGEDHLGHVRKHQSIDAARAGERRHVTEEEVASSRDSIVQAADGTVASGSIAQRTETRMIVDEERGLEAIEDYAAQLISVFIFEFGVIFHSVIIGLTLAVTGDNFTTLYIVLVFHQTFEGLALGTRLAVVPFSKARRSTPYAMAVAYGLSTPLAIAIGLALRHSYTSDSSRALLVQGIFDAVSAGILLYTGLIELMAHEFLFSETFRPVMRGKRLRLFAAYGCMMLGAGLMALLGYWA